MATICLSAVSYGQTSGVSPYSAYGLGDLSTSAFAQQLSMGQLSLILDDNATINVGNAATYGNLRNTVFDVGIQSRFLEINTGDRSFNVSNTKVRNMALGFPIVKNKWGLSLGLIPVSNVGYQLSDSEVLDSGGSVNYQYEGEGGLSQIYLGAGGKIWKNDKHILSIGSNVAFVFGSVEKIRKAVYPEDQGFYNTRSRESLIIRDLSLELATHYHTELKFDSLERKKLQVESNIAEVRRLLDVADPADSSLTRKLQKQLDRWSGKRSRVANRARKVELLAGFNYRFGSNLSAEQALLAETYILGAGDVEFPRDTIEFIEGQEGTVFLPETWSLGLGIRLNETLTIGIEGHLRDWRKYRTSFNTELGSRAELASASRISIGMQYYPMAARKRVNKKNLLNSFKYRLGARYLNNYLRLNDHQLNQYGISFGVGIPMFKAWTNSWLHLGTELGERGTLNNDLIQERYINIYLGFTISPRANERWFRKSRID